MVDAISSSLQGLNNAAQRLSNSAQRIAQAGTSAYKAADAQTKPPADINLTQELVESKLAEVSYTANATIIKAQLKTDKDLLNILA
ncbi:MAG: hypothetical protein EB059_07075 [Alphaproteobacteria bacterium]|nr:hypothetical protein [Alphaproteobacteria bacterium]